MPVLLRRLGLTLLAVLAANRGLNAAADEPEFLQHTPNDRSLVMYVPDPLPHLLRTAKSPGFQRVITRMFQGQLGGPDTSTWEPTLNNSVAPYLPTEIVFSLNDQATTNLSRLFRMMLHVGLCNGAIEADASEDFDKLQQVLIAEMGQWKLEGIDLWVNFRTPLPAALVFGQANSLTASLFDVEGVEVTHQGQSIRLQSQLGNFYDEQTLQFLLLEFGVATDLDSEGTSALGAAVAKLEIDVTVQMVGNAIQLRFGHVADFEPLRGESLGELWTTDPRLVFFASYRMQGFLDSVAGIVKEWEKWEPTATGKATTQLDEEDLLGDLSNIVRMVGQSSLDGASRLEWNDDLELVLHEYGVPTADSLTTLPITKFVPATGDIVMASSTYSVADQWNSQLTQFEDRLASNSMKYELTGRLQQAEMNEQMTVFYYQKLRKFRQLVKERSYDVFRAPTITIADGRGTIRRLSARFHIDEESSGFAMNDLSVPRVAVMGRLQEGADAETLMKDVWRAFLEGVMPEDITGLQLVESVDYGLGCPTFAFSGEWQEELPNDVRIMLEGDMMPHYFTLPDGLFVLSSSSELSRAIVAAGNGSGERFDLPASEDQLVGFGVIPGISLAQISGTLTSLFDYVMDEQSDLELEGETLQIGRTMLAADQNFYDTMQGLFSSLTLACASVDSIQWQSTQQTDRRVTKGSMSFNTP
ncbi:MAG: hypothetical protein NXI04_23530 [Planctomycetaceae bacterium]|nr:hypothetical protein [Planctomycetaceae bacterium]